MPRPGNDLICQRCGSTYGDHSGLSCPDGSGGYTNGGWVPPSAALPPLDARNPLLHALAEGVHVLAQKLYKESARKHVLKSVTLDRELLCRAGILDECQIHTSVGPVKVMAESAFAGIDRSVSETSWVASVVSRQLPLAVQAVLDGAPTSSEDDLPPF